MNMLHEPITPATDISKKWYEVDGIVHATITTSGIELSKCTPPKSHHIEDGAREMLRSTEYHITREITSNIAIVNIHMFNDMNLHTSIRKQAVLDKMLAEGYGIPNAGIAMEMFATWTMKDFEEMNFSMIDFMHPSIDNRWFAISSHGGRYMLESHVNFCGTSKPYRPPVPQRGLVFIDK